MEREERITCVPIRTYNEYFFHTQREETRKPTCVIDLFQPSRHQATEKGSKGKVSLVAASGETLGDPHYQVKSYLHLLLYHH